MKILGEKLKNRKYRKDIELSYHNIKCYQKLIALSIDPEQTKFYEKRLENEVRRLDYWQWCEQQINKPRVRMNETSQPDMKEFTIEELAQYDGSDGKPAYVAVNGIVYDVSNVEAWNDATHFGLRAGRELSDLFNGCHYGIMETLRDVPKVGVLV